MSRLTYESQTRCAPRPGEEWRGRYEMGERTESRMPAGLLIAGAAALGLGLLAWNYFGPDLRRYLKIRNM